MDNITADKIAKKARALRHCNKVIGEIDKNGSTIITLNCTGVSFTVNKNDAIYLQLQSTRAQLIQEIGSYEIVQKTIQRDRRDVPAPMGASSALTDEEMEALKKAKQRENYKRWYSDEKNREKHKAYCREYSRKRRSGNPNPATT